jgi:hypothetical protein
VITLRHVGRVVASVVRFGFSTRNVAIVVAVIGGLLLLVAALAAQTAAPFVLYPFV